MTKTTRPLSEKPSAIRSRIRKSAKKLDRDATMLYKPIEEWDMEELAKGRPRNRAGNFQGPRPNWVTPLIIKEAQERARSLTRSELLSYTGDAMRVMHKLMTDESTDFNTGKPLVSPSTRLDAAKYILDQSIGKATNPVEITGNVVLQSLMADVLVNPGGDLSHPVIEGEVASSADEDDEDDDSEEG